MSKSIEDKKERNFVATVIFVVKNGKVLLGRKKEKIGAGRYNGPGGEVEKCDPSIEFRATLEMWQEIHIVCDDEKLQKVAVGYFTNIRSDGSEFLVEVHFFLVEKRSCVGIPRSSNEMTDLKWFKQGNAPLSEMMAADNIILPLIFKSKKIIIWATLKNKQSELVGDVGLIEVKSF